MDLERIVINGTLGIINSNPSSINKIYCTQLMSVIIIFCRPNQNQNQNFGSSAAQANANAFNQQFRPDGFGASAANAGAQAFQTNGPLGGFGASASNAQSQAFNVGPNGLSVSFSTGCLNW